jgi:hypothetical protein
MIAAANVEQSDARNVCVAEVCRVPEASTAAQMGLVARDVLAMRPTGLPAGVAGVAGVAGGGDGAEDAQSAGTAPDLLDNEATCMARHTRRHISAGDAAPILGCAAAVDQGGRGSRRADGAAPLIGFKPAENFTNGPILVHAAACTDHGTLLARDMRSGALVIVHVQGIDIKDLCLPAVLACEKKEGALVFSGPLPPWRCGQCGLSTPHDCLEQPCGWQAAPKKKEAAP